MCKLIEIIQFVFPGLSVEGAFNWPEVANTNQIQKGRKEENRVPHGWGVTEGQVQTLKEGLRTLQGTRGLSSAPPTTAGPKCKLPVQSHPLRPCTVEPPSCWVLGSSRRVGRGLGAEKRSPGGVGGQLEDRPVCWPRVPSARSTNPVNFT